MKTKKHKLPTAATIREAIHPHKPVVPPPDPENLNEDRANAAESAIQRFAEDFGETIGGQMVTLEAQNLTDLLCDFGHYCDRNGIDLQNCIRMAAYNYAEETENVGQQFSTGDPIERMYDEAFAEGPGGWCEVCQKPISATQGKHCDTHAELRITEESQVQA